MTTRKGMRGNVGVVIAVLVALLLILLIAVLAWKIFGGKEPQGVPPVPPRPDKQSASCPDVQVIAIPGTWETNAADDPHDPRANPLSLMLNVTNPLQQEFPRERAEMYTVPYVAQFSNPIAIPPDGQVSYNESRAQGTQRATAELQRQHEACPLTSYILMGFSQGAVIVGDLAAQIGAGKGPVPEDLVLGVTIIADGRRAPNQAIAVGPNPPGVGAEVVLSGLQFMGISMTGARPGGFGKLADRTNNICTPGDWICDAPTNVMVGVVSLLPALQKPVHNMYNSFVIDDAGTTATQWTAKWAADLIRNAPHPEHF